MQKEQQLQDDEYGFPYHYIASLDNGFTQHYNWPFGIYYLTTLTFLLERLSQCKFDNYVDIGCGDGRLATEVNQHFSDAKIVGVDYSQAAISLATVMGKGANFQCRDIMTEGFEEQYDVATLIEVLEHIPPKIVPDFIKAVASSLKPGGKLLMTVPHKNKPLQEKHFQHFNLEMLKSIFAHDFEVNDVVYFEKKCFMERMINKVLTNPIFVLKHQGLLNIVYNYFKSKLFFASDKNCGRVFLELTKR
ncbi:MAG: class I SAM-dependent methyltransferase [Candidatus Cloacimonetes bacterium]|nr:class I SAM-dependent methyltransferase [Candidatus Cloacimonadota bacterium]